MDIIVALSLCRLNVVCFLYNKHNHQNSRSRASGLMPGHWGPWSPGSTAGLRWDVAPVHGLGFPGRLPPLVLDPTAPPVRESPEWVLVVVLVIKKMPIQHSNGIIIIWWSSCIMIINIENTYICAFRSCRFFFCPPSCRKCFLIYHFLATYCGSKPQATTRVC